MSVDGGSTLVPKKTAKAFVLSPCEPYARPRAVVFLLEPGAASEKLKLCKLMIKERSFRSRSSQVLRSTVLKKKEK